MLSSPRRPGLSSKELHELHCPSFEELRASTGRGYGVLMSASDTCQDLASYYRKAMTNLQGSEAALVENKAKFFDSESKALLDASTGTQNPNEEALNKQVWERYCNHHYWLEQTVFKGCGDNEYAQQQLAYYNGPKPPL